INSDVFSMTDDIPQRSWRAAKHTHAVASLHLQMPHSYSNSRGGGTGSPIEIIDRRDRNRREELARTDPERSSAASGENGGLAEKGRIELPSRRIVAIT